MSRIVYKELTSLPSTLEELERESVAAGFGMITRLRRDWESGTNRFQEDGEIFLGAFRGRKLVGTGGLSRDPYVFDPSVGRVRHVYVMEGERRAGAAKVLVQRLIVHAGGRFKSVRLSTARASLFYESLGFAPITGEHVTHAMALE